MNSKLLILVVTMLIFIGQNFAAPTNSCNLMSTNSDDGQMMDHSTHQMSDMSETSDTASDSTMDCCDSGADCSMSGCAFIALIPTSSIAISAPISDSLTEFSVTAPRHISVSLYRPPIFS